uniref:Uncharacterized protein n=1 Tax=Sphaerodactylus townsendi TaxID=933632 RepID=A0ACB8EU05_9SAUR
MFSAGEPPEDATAAGAASGNNGRPIPVDLTGTSDSASNSPDGERPPPGSGDSASRGYLDTMNPFLTAPLDSEQGVTVRCRQGQNSQIPDSGSALWATAPLAGNVSFGDRPSGDISASEAKVWRLLQTSGGAWQAERDEYLQALRHMEQDMEHLHAALAQARQGIPGQPVPQPRGAPPAPPAPPTPATLAQVPPAPAPPAPAPPAPAPVPPGPAPPAGVPVGVPIPPGQPAPPPMIPPLHPFAKRQAVPATSTPVSKLSKLLKGVTCLMALGKLSRLSGDGLACSVMPEGSTLDPSIPPPYRDLWQVFEETECDSLPPHHNMDCIG